MPQEQAGLRRCRGHTGVQDQRCRATSRRREAGQATRGERQRSVLEVGIQGVAEPVGCAEVMSNVGHISSVEGKVKTS